MQSNGDVYGSHWEISCKMIGKTRLIQKFIESLLGFFIYLKNHRAQLDLHLWMKQTKPQPKAKKKVTNKNASMLAYYYK